LIGAETSKRQFVDYEITKSYGRGNGLLGIYINKLKDRDGTTDSRGVNPLSTFSITKDDKKIYLSEIYPTYDWVDDDGYKNCAKWIEEAAKAAGK
jgi:hypothetical protein